MGKGEEKLSNMYWDFAHSVREKLKAEVNGSVKFELYSTIDTVIFKIYFREFDFKYGISEVSSVIYNGKVDDIVENILQQYKKVVFNAFFKSDVKKREEEMRKLGVMKEEYT